MSKVEFNILELLEENNTCYEMSFANLQLFISPYISDFLCGGPIPYIPNQKTYVVTAMAFSPQAT